MKNNELYQEWLENSHVPQTMKDEMQKMSAEDIESSFLDIPLKFGTAGYRAKMGPGPLYLNIFTYQQLAVGYARYIVSHFDKTTTHRKPKIIIVHDNRLNGDSMTFRIANVMTSFGIEVYLSPNNLALPTPIVSYLARKYDFDGALNLTASHNPKEYNGFKAYNNHGAQVTTEQAEEISSLLPPWDENIETVYVANTHLVNYIKTSQIESYFVSVTRAIGLTGAKPTASPVIFTSHHGACSIWGIKFLRGLGHNIIPVSEQCYINPQFENSPIMNPEDPQSFELSVKLADEKKSDIVIGVDPDGDRMAVAIKHKGKWEYLTGNETGILATYYLLHNRTNEDLLPVVISTYVTNTLINKIVENYNGMVIRTATGFKNIATAMEYIDPSKAQFIVGFEEAIGMCISSEIREKDGISATALILEIYNFFKEINMDLLDALEQRVYAKYGLWYGETVSIKIPGSDWKQKAEQLEHAALSIKPRTLDQFSIEEVFWNEAGSCIEWKLNNDNWIKFRISGTEPKFKIYYNLYFTNETNPNGYERAKYQQAVAELTAKIKKMLNI